MNHPTFEDLYEPLMSHEDFAAAVNDSDIPVTLGVTDDDDPFNLFFSPSIVLVENNTESSDETIMTLLNALGGTSKL